MIDKRLIDVLMKMFEIVDVKFNQKRVKQKDWFLENTWTPEQQEEYIEWLTQELVKCPDLRKVISSRPQTKSYKHNRKVAEAFVFDYGWKTKWD